MAERAGWHQVITAFPAALTTVAYRYESGDWFVPDPDFNEASVVGARITPLFTEAEVSDMIATALAARTEFGALPQDRGVAP